MNTDADRERGMLSAADREYLLGERQFGHDQSKRNAEARIRRRIREAILDFDLLLHTLSEKDRRQVFERTTTDESFRDALRAMLAFVYLGTETYGGGFEEILEPAVGGSEEYLAAADRDESVSVDVTFEVETTVESSLDGVAARLDAGDPVTPRELFSVVMQGDYDVSACDRISLVGTDEHHAKEGFLERLASYLDGDLRRINDSRAVIRLPDASPAE